MKKGSLKSKLVIAVKQIHGNFSSVSSEDKWLYKIIESVRDLKEKVKNKNSDEYITLVYTESDKTFYNQALGMRKFIGYEYPKSQMKRLINHYRQLGWTTKQFKEVKQFWKRDNIRYWKNRKKNNYVRNKEKMLPIDFRGGFSSQVYLHEQFVEYTKDGHAFGYIGHFVRKPRLDKYFEKAFLSLQPKTKTNLLDIFVCWLTSTSGRHFGDSLEELSFKKQKEMINSKLRYVYNEGYIFLLPEHEGTLSSTEQLMSKHKNKLFV